MPRSVTPYLGNGLVPDGPKPAPGRPRLPKTVTVVHGRAILHPNASANAFVPVTINPVPPFLVAHPRNREVGLTRRASGLATLAAELHFVRRPWHASVLHERFM